MSGFPIGYRLSFVAAGSAELHFVSERLLQGRFAVAHSARAHFVAVAGPWGWSPDAAPTVEPGDVDC